MVTFGRNDDGRPTRTSPFRLSDRRFWLGSPLRASLFFCTLVVVGVSTGALAGISQPFAVLVAVGLGGVAILSTRPVLIAVLAVPLLFWVHRLGPGGEISYADAGLAAAGLIALPALAGSRELKACTPALQLIGFYLATLVASLIAHHPLRADIEWLHRLILLAGATLTGAWIVREGQLRVALRMLAAAATFVAVSAIVYSAAHGFTAAYPLGMHKNFVGSSVGIALVALLAAPSQFELRPVTRVGFLVLWALGVLASQSRGAMLGVTLGALLWFIRSVIPSKGEKVRSRGKIVAVVVAAGLGYFAYISINEQLNSAEMHNTSAGVRLRVEEKTRELWRTSPLVGVGIRYFNSGLYGPDAQNPNNAFDNELAESGLIGTAGFTVMHVGIFVLLWRVRTELGIAAFAVVVGRFLHGQVDIYWAAGLSSLPFVMVGAALAQRSQQPLPPSPKEFSVSRS